MPELQSEQGHPAQYLAASGPLRTTRNCPNEGLTKVTGAQLLAPGRELETMPWFNVDDSFYDHPKVWDAPDCAVALWCRAGSWSARSPRRGFVPAGMPARLCGDPETAVRELLERRLWLRTKGGYLFHDWNDWNLSSEEVERKRKLNAERQRRYRESAAKDAGGDDVTASVTRDVTRDKRVSNAPQSNPIQSAVDVEDQSSVRDARGDPAPPRIVTALADRLTRPEDDDDVLSAVIRSMKTRTGRVLSAAEARPIAASILRSAKRNVGDPAAYVAKAIEREKDPVARWLSQPETFQGSFLVSLPGGRAAGPPAPPPQTSASTRDPDSAERGAAMARKLMADRAAEQSEVS